MSGPLRRLRYELAKQPWSLRYIFEKATQQTNPFGLTEAFGEDGKKEEEIPAMELMRRINEQVLDTPLCSRMLFRGEAMAPALSCAPRFGSAASSGTQALNMLVVRPLRHEETMPATYDRVGRRWFYPRPARVGDVVAFVHPDSASRPAEQQVVLVRRVAALAGDVLVSVNGVDISAMAPEDAFKVLVAAAKALPKADAAAGAAEGGDEDMTPPPALVLKFVRPLRLEAAALTALEAAAGATLGEAGTVHAAPLPLEAWSAAGSHVVRVE